MKSEKCIKESFIAEEDGEMKKMQSTKNKNVQSEN